MGPAKHAGAGEYQLTNDPRRAIERGRQKVYVLKCFTRGRGAKYRQHCPNFPVKMKKPRKKAVIKQNVTVDTHGEAEDGKK